eukprot:scaffold21967_cov114-Isochrysis_galbana.AAC.7
MACGCCFTARLGSAGVEVCHPGHLTLGREEGEARLRGDGAKAGSGRWRWPLCGGRAVRRVCGIGTRRSPPLVLPAALVPPETAPPAPPSQGWLEAPPECRMGFVGDGGGLKREVGSAPDGGARWQDRCGGGWWREGERARGKGSGAAAQKYSA